MYFKHFNLKARPFENTPDPAFFFLGAQYRDVLTAMIHSVVSRKSLMVVSGPIGSGKTTLGRTLTRFLPEKTQVVSVLHPLTAFGELLAFVAHGLGLDQLPESRLLLIEAVRHNLENLHRGGGSLLLLIDEAQLLQDESLEEIRLLTNLETEKVKLVQIILLGQPELLHTLKRSELRQLRQRISTTKILEPLDGEQTINYIRHRLKVAGARLEIFDQDALRMIYELTGGIPRVINQLCDQSLLEAFAARQERVIVEAVSRAAADVGLSRFGWSPGFKAEIPELKAPTLESWPSRKPEPLSPFPSVTAPPQPEPAGPSFEPKPHVSPPKPSRPRLEEDVAAEFEEGPATAESATILAALTDEPPLVRSRPSWFLPLFLMGLGLLALVLSLFLFFGRAIEPKSPLTATPSGSGAPSKSIGQIPIIPPPTKGD